METDNAGLPEPALIQVCYLRFTHGAHRVDAGPAACERPFWEKQEKGEA